MLKFNGFQLKIFMAILMVFDHIGKIPNLISTDMELIFHLVTRCVAVFFGYMAVEGFIYTSNRKKYIERLLMWSIIMFIGNFLLSYFNLGILIYNNIFLTLFVGVLTLNIFFSNKQQLNKFLKIFLGSLITFLGIFFTEGGIVIIPFMIITYYFYNNHKLRNTAYLILSLLLFVMSFTMYPTLDETIKMLAYNSDFMFIIVIPFIYMYNGQRGTNSKFGKYFFYVFYPLHLWIISLIGKIFV